MKLEQLVTNLETSKRLKELGCPQNSYFLYDPIWGTEEIEDWEVRHESLYAKLPEESCSAYTLSELIEMLGDELAGIVRSDDGIWFADFFSDTIDQDSIQGKTPLLAVSALLIQLLEDGTLSF